MTEPAPTPRQRIHAECERTGQLAFVRRCLTLLRRARPDPDLVRVLAGPAARWGRQLGPEQAYWLRVWALRGLLWAWEDEAVPAVVAALGDEAWRVREMAAKVVARHRIGAALQSCATLRADPVPRVRQAAERAVRTLTAEHA